MLILEFGEKVSWISPRYGLSYKGSWTLVIEMGGWTLYRKSKLVTSGQEAKDAIDTHVTEIVGSVVDNVLLSNKQAVFFFSNEYRLKIIDTSIDGKDDEWHLSTPFSKVLIKKFGVNVTLEDSSLSTL